MFDLGIDFGSILFDVTTFVLVLLLSILSAPPGLISALVTFDLGALTIGAIMSFRALAYALLFVTGIAFFALPFHVLAKMSGAQPLVFSRSARAWDTWLIAQLAKRGLLEHKE